MKGIVVVLVLVARPVVAQDRYLSSDWTRASDPPTYTQQVTRKGSSRGSP
jgi:hypothetical protein